MDIFSDMAIFVEVVRANSFSKGAANLNMPASTVSRRIAELEKRLGLRLLIRTTRTLSLTDAGAVYYGRCRRLVEEATLAQEEITDVLNNAQGTLKMSLPADFAKYQLAPLILAFQQQHPNVTFQLDLSPKQVNLTSDPYDLAIRIGDLPDSGLISRKITELELALFASPHYLQNRPALDHPNALEYCDTLSMNNKPWPLKHGANKHTIEHSPNITANSMGMLIQLAENGGGIAPLAPSLVRQQLDEGTLVPVLPEWVFDPLPAYALTETRLLPAKTRLFIEFLVQAFSKQ